MSPKARLGPPGAATPQTGVSFHLAAPCSPSPALEMLRQGVCVGGEWGGAARQSAAAHLLTVERSHRSHWLVTHCTRLADVQQTSLEAMYTCPCVSRVAFVPIHRGCVSSPCCVTSSLPPLPSGSIHTGRWASAVFLVLLPNLQGHLCRAGAAT